MKKRREDQSLISNLIEERKSRQALPERGKQQNVLASTTYLITIQQILKSTLTVGIACLAGIRMLGPQKLEDEAHVFQNIRGMGVDALPRLDLRHAGRNELGDRHQFLDPPCVRGRSGTHHLLHALVCLELHQADAARGAGRDGRVGAERRDKCTGGSGSFENGAVGRHGD